MEDVEDKFKQKLYAKYAENKKNFIPKEVYYQIIEDMKSSKDTITKGRQQYYYLGR